MKKRPIWIDDDLHARFKAAAALKRTNMRAWNEELIRKALLDEADRARVLVDSRTEYQTQEATE